MTFSLHLFRKLYSIADRVSAFGQVELLTRMANTDDNDNDDLKTEIANELMTAYRSVDVFNVSVIELDSATSGNISCFYEVLLNNQTEPSSGTLSFLTLNDTATYANSVVRYEGK